MDEPGAITPAQLAAIQEFDTCRIANAIETLNVRLRNEGFTRPGLKSLCGYAMSAIGFAVTARFRSSDTPVTGKQYVDRTDWWEHTLSLPAPRLAVFEDLDDNPGRGSFVGEVHAAILRALGCAGAVTNGSVRDLPALREMRFPLFARTTSVSHAYAHMVDYGSPVSILGLTVHPGDLLYADCHGVVSIPLSIADKVAEIAARQHRRERRVIDFCRSKQFSLERLRAELQDAAQEP